MSAETKPQNDAITLQDSDPLPKAPESPSNGWTSLVPMILIFVVFYFLLIRPQEKRRKAQQELISGVKKGEEVLTNSGMIGVVTKINDSDNTIMVEVAKGIEIKMVKTAVANILTRERKEIAAPAEKVKTKEKVKEKK